MDNRVLERIVIIILLLLDVFLMSAVVSDRIESRRSEAETVERVVGLLAERGIEAAEGAVRVEEALPRKTLLRSDVRETEIVRAMLGKASQEDQGGNIMFYRSSGGQAVFRGSGEVAALFSGGTVPLRGSAEKTAERLMRRMEIGAEILETGTDDTGMPYAVCLCCADGSPVFNAALRFDFSDSGLYMITGTRLFDEAGAEEAAVGMNSVSALLHFVEAAEQEGMICSRLERCRPGYLLSVVVSGESSLTPVWQIVTDTGVFLINAETGKLEQSGV